MAEQDPLLRLGWLTLSTLDDARNSTITGTTLNGPLGSGQFYPVYASTVSGKDLQVRLFSTSWAGTSTLAIMGILQNKPGPGEAADIGFLGVSKVICGATANTQMGTLLQVSSVSTGMTLGGLSAWAGGNTGAPVGYLLETPASTGAIVTAMINFSGLRST